MTTNTSTYPERLSRELQLGSLANIGTDAQRQAPGTEPSIDEKTVLALSAGPNGTEAERILDQRDAELVLARLAAHDRWPDPRCGDFVDFADGVTERISHVWTDDPSDPEWHAGFQTSAGGRWHLGDYACSFSGSLNPSITPASLTRTDETRLGSAWIFHHAYKVAHNGVDFRAPFRVYSCSHASDARR